MTKDEFWGIIEAARDEGGEADEIAERVQAELKMRAPEVVYAFLEHQGKLMEESYTWALWGAAYLINGGCSDDGFDYFRGWLLAQGRALFERALADADSLGDLVPEGDEVESEDMLAAGSNAYKTLTGSYPKGPKIHLPALGDGWDFDDAKEMEKHYPRTWAKFGR